MGAIYLRMLFPLLFRKGSILEDSLRNSPARLEKLRQLDVQLSERLKSFGIMGDQFEGPLKTPRISQHHGIEEFYGGL